MSERFDIYDQNGRHIGVKPRAAVHRDGDWHQVFHCWVVGRDSKRQPFVVLQKRGPHQDTFPNRLDISAAGHLAAGETVADGIRELEEELGLRADYEDLIPLGTRVGVQKLQDLFDRQICHVFLYECSQPLADYAYSPVEVAGLVKLPLDAGLRLFAGEVDCVQVAAVGLGAAQTAITRADFVPSSDGYVLRALTLARRYFEGERDLKL